MSEARRLSQEYSKDQIQDILINFSLLLLNKRTEEEVIWSVTKNCISYLGFEDCVVYLVDKKANVLIQKAAYGPKCENDDQIKSPMAIPIGQGITGHVAKTGKPLLIKDTSVDSRYIADDKNRLSEICVPLKLEDRVIGVIDCEHSDKHYFTTQHQDILTAVASICTIKISQLRADKLILEKEKETLRINEQMAQLKLKALQSQLNPHFIFNALGAIQYFLSVGDHRTALEYLSIFGQVLRYITKQIEENEVLIDHEIKALNNYLNLQKLRYEERFEFAIEQNDSLTHNHSKSIPSFLLLNLIEEVIESHIGLQENKMKINILFKSEPNHLIFSTDVSYHPTSGSSSGYRLSYPSWEKLVNQNNEFLEKAIKYTYDKSSKAINGLMQTQIRVEIPLN